MIKLLRGPIEGRTYLEIDEELLTELAGIEVQAGGESYVIRFTRPPQEEPGIIEPSVFEKPTSVTTPKKTKAQKRETTTRVAKKTFADLLRKARKAKGMTHEALSEASGLHKSSISRFETSTGMPTEVSLAALNAALGTDWVL